MKRNPFFKFSNIVSKYPQPVNVKEWSLLSRYELVCYIILFLLCGFLFYKWNSPQKRDIYIDAEESLAISTYSCKAMADITLPMTVMEKKNGHMSFEFVYSVDSTVREYHKADREYVQSLLDSTGYESDNLSYLRLGGEISSSFAIFAQKEIKVPSPEFVNIEISTIRRGLFVKGYYVTYLTRIYGKTYDNSQELTLSGNTNNPLGRPRWLSLFDISQAHIYVHVKSRTCDTLNVNIDLKGPADIYDINGSACDIRGSGVSYQLLNSNHNGLDEDIHIYARLKDLENMQTIRMFAITAIMSSLLAILVAFIIIFLYRLFKTNDLVEQQ